MSSIASLLAGKFKAPTTALQPDLKPNAYLQAVIVASVSEATKEGGVGIGRISFTRCDLDSHANMVVCGKHTMVVNNTGKFAEVNGFSPELESLRKVPIVDAAIAYDCPYSMKSYLLLIRNALYVPAMDHNLLVPFIMREAGCIVNE